MNLFIYACNTTYSVVFVAIMSDGRIMRLLILVIPVGPGKSRIMIGSPLIPKLPKWFMWLSHSISGRFLDSDIWVHDQERMLRGLSNSYAVDVKSSASLPYILPTESDNGPRLFRLWWNKHLKESLVFGPSSADKLNWIPIADQRNRFENHVKSCKDCQMTLSKAEAVRKWLPFVAVTGLALSRTLQHRLFVAALFSVSSFATSKIIKAINGPDMTEKVSAAQFPEQ